MARRLKSLEDCRRALSYVWNELHDDRMDPQKSSKLGYLLQIMVKTLEQTDIERRLEKLEESEDQRRG